MKKTSIPFILLFLLILSILSCGDQSSKSLPATKKEATRSLSNKFDGAFTIGTALNQGLIQGEDSTGLALLEKEFNAITPENIMKWSYTQPTADSFDFSIADRYLELGKKNNMEIVGHALVWHSQLADYMNEVQDSATMATYLDDHIRTITNHYKGKIDAWDVVNEALNDDGSLRESNFLKVMGPAYIEQAFRTTAEMDPSADLIYNDYNMWDPKKRAGAIKLVKNLQTKGIKIDGIGMQGHWSLGGPDLKEIENSIIAYSELGVKVMITELDVTVLPNPWDLKGAEVSQNFEGSPFMNPYPEWLPDSIQVKLADRYVDIFNLFLKHQDKISRVTFWGLTDKVSWLNNWPIDQRTNYPLLFDRDYLPKPAYHAVMNLSTKPTNTNK